MLARSLACSYNLIIRVGIRRRERGCFTTHLNSNFLNANAKNLLFNLRIYEIKIIYLIKIYSMSSFEVIYSLVFLFLPMGAFINFLFKKQTNKKIKLKWYRNKILEHKICLVEEEML